MFSLTDLNKSFISLWRSEKPLADSSYFHDHPEYYHTGDSGYVDDDGYVYIMSRTGDIINVAGHRLSTGALEEIICSNPHVAECAVIGIFDEVKGQVRFSYFFFCFFVWVIDEKNL